MSINTAGYLEISVTSQIIERALKSIGINVLHNGVVYNPLSKGETGFIHIGEEGNFKSIFFCTLDDKDFFGNKRCSCISLIQSDESLKIITEIVEIFGGYVEEIDNGQNLILVEQKRLP